MAITPQTNATFDDIAHVLADHDDFVICGHVNPDGDCLGSQLTLWHALRAIGKRATCVLVQDAPIPQDLAFMPGIEHMVPAEQFQGTAATFVGVDVPTRERVGEAACAILDTCTQSVTIDHHAVDTTMCQHVYVDPDSASASLLVWEVAKRLCDVPPFESALCAYTGLVTDTGGFRYQNADANAFSKAGELVQFGVEPSYVAMNVFGSRSLASLKLEQKVIERLQMLVDGQVALSWINRSDMESAGAVKADTEPLIEVLRSLSGVRVACMMREQDGIVRGSLRAKDETDVAALARELGGGGHTAAAGFSMDMALADAVELLREKLTALVQ